MGDCYYLYVFFEKSHKNELITSTSSWLCTRYMAFRKYGPAEGAENSPENFQEIFQGEFPENYRNSAGELPELYRNSTGELPELYRRITGTLPENYRNSAGS